MVIRKISFSNGYINITEDKISYYNGNQHQTIERKCIGTIKTIEKTFLQKDSFTYSLRLIFFSLVVFALALITSIGFLTYLGLFICAYGFIALFVNVFFGLIGYRDASNFLIRVIFGIRGYEVTIHNNCGAKNIIFNIDKSDKNKINSIDQYRISANEKPVIETALNLNELEKLAELLKKGIITEEEFNIKKKQILGL
ncbi:SHOCT domain-containing protein [Flavobacterium lacisediminis]|uniref:SHOCT domain-containing protein n=1 Tax=Flavobacterium lacisediminis TaxID=2989705 RepID=A0ABT3EHJ1_9FLAO|nr:SHOCT domain-containing protein [Flavobacterium lacisediminis]MCW1148037.1 SHOCT domain-containing protein [Flavobacterium lacisediminis]